MYSNNYSLFINSQSGTQFQLWHDMLDDKNKLPTDKKDRFNRPADKNLIDNT